MKIVQILLSAFLITCVSTVASADGELKDVIQSREDAWTAAYNANDAAAVGAFYESDAVLVAPGMSPIKGREAIAAALSGLFPVLTELKLIVDDVVSLGDNYAVEIGHSTYTAVSPDGTTAPGIDNYQVVWHKGDDGVWRYVTDMFNSQ